MPPEITPRVWAEIDPDALAHNISLLKRRFGPSRIMAVVKADAYGHGAPLIAPLCARYGLSDFGVATPAEGAALRLLLLPDAAIYLLGPALPSEASAIVYHRLTLLLSSLEMGQVLSEAARKQNVIATAHLDIDTGIGRAGVQLSDAVSILSAFDTLPNLEITGLATHFADADDNPTDAQSQHNLFLSFLQTLGRRANSLLIHAANSPAALNLSSNVRHTLLRPGLLLYGIEPTPGLFAERGLSLKPVLSLKTRVTLCRALPAGATISYGRTYTVPAGGGVYATLGVGYGDGYPRGLSNRGSVLIHGRRAPICGRVCMDQVVVDVNSVPGVKAGDIATLIGTDGVETLTAGDLAALIPTTPHEITTRLTARVARLLRSYAVSC
ncbi:MAG: alanine racemase [Janthinobacterium lividum]